MGRKGRVHALAALGMRLLMANASAHDGVGSDLLNADHRESAMPDYRTCL
jgi:hypothetical protein